MIGGFCIRVVDMLLAGTDERHVLQSKDLRADAYLLVKQEQRTGTGIGKQKTKNKSPLGKLAASVGGKCHSGS